MLQDTLAFPSRQSDTRCQRNTCRANEHLCSSGQPLIPPKACHKTSQWARRMQKPHDTCFCVSYHFSIICISFISQTQSCEPVWQASSLSYGGCRERNRLMKHCDLCFSDRDGLQHAMLSVGLIVYEDRRGRWIQVELGVDVHCCFHFVSYWVKFHLQCWRHLHQIFFSLFLLCSDFWVLSCAFFKGYTRLLLFDYVHIIKKLDKLF